MKKEIIREIFNLILRELGEVDEYEGNFDVYPILTEISKAKNPKLAENAKSKKSPIIYQVYKGISKKYGEFAEISTNDPTFSNDPEFNKIVAIEIEDFIRKFGD